MSRIISSTSRISIERIDMITLIAALIVAILCYRVLVIIMPIALLIVRINRAELRVISIRWPNLSLLSDSMIVPGRSQ